jgi:hypothetical protein
VSGSPRHLNRVWREIDRAAFERAVTGPGYRPATWVYFVQMTEAKYIKVGVATNIKKRMASLQNGNPERLILLCKTRGDQRLERMVHTYLREHRMSGEWFRWNPIAEEVVQYVKGRKVCPFHFWLLTRLRAQEALGA